MPAESFGLSPPFDVRRYDGSALAVELGPRFRLLKSVPELHRTPWDAPQPFQYSLFERV